MRTRAHNPTAQKELRQLLNVVDMNKNWNNGRSSKTFAIPQ